LDTGQAFLSPERRFAAGFDKRKRSLLVRSNWIRVAAWSAAAIIALWMCWQVLA